MTYTVELRVPDRSARYCMRILDRRIVGSRRAADLCARSLLRPHHVYCTRYYVQRDVARAPDCAIYRGQGKRGDLRVILEYVEPSHTVVPSVGELGWTP